MLSGKLSVVFKVPSPGFSGYFPEHYGSVRHRARRVAIFRDERGLLAGLCRWLAENRINVSLGRNIDDDVGFVVQRMHHYGMEHDRIQPFIHRSKVYFNKKLQTHIDVRIGVVDGWTITV